MHLHPLPQLLVDVRQLLLNTSRLNMLRTTLLNPPPTTVLNKPLYGYFSVRKTPGSTAQSPKRVRSFIFCALDSKQSEHCLSFFFFFLCCPLPRSVCFYYCFVPLSAFPMLLLFVVVAFLVFVFFFSAQGVHRLRRVPHRGRDDGRRLLHLGKGGLRDARVQQRSPAEGYFILAFGWLVGWFVGLLVGQLILLV